MVDQANIARVQFLIGQRTSYRQALAMFDEGGSIRAFILQSEGSTPPDRSRPPHQAWVEAEGIAYPPQMIDTIKQQLTTRISEIEKELADLGVTNLDAEPPFSAMKVRSHA